jgi:hypothetical protein
MSQVSLYVDKEMYEKLGRAAFIRDVSISKFVAALLSEHFHREKQEVEENSES